MRKLLILVATFALPLAAAAAEELAAAAGDAALAEETAAGTPDDPFLGSDVTLEQFLWTARPLVIFANTPADPAFQRQMELLRLRPEPLAERDVVVIVDTDPATPSSVRRTLRPRGFMLVIMDKDGQVELRKPAPWDVREISRTIDKMPLRIQEARDRGLGGR